MVCKGGFRYMVLIGPIRGLAGETSIGIRLIEGVPGCHENKKDLG